MHQTPPAPAPTAPAPLGPARRALRSIAIAAAVPYLTLKTAWLAGSRIGIPEGSVLREPGLFFTVANAATLLMDVALVVIVLALTQPWGRRIPAWLMAVPVFTATGLLTPIVGGFPAVTLFRALGGEPDPAQGGASEPFLDAWVFNVVYVGFSVQALALAGLFVPYARERWGHLWQGRLGQPMSAAIRAAAVAGAAAALVFAAVELYWTCGGTAGLSAGLAATWSSDSAVMAVVHSLSALAGAAGGLLLAFGGRRAVRGPLALAWVAGSAAAAWGLWLGIAAFGPEADPGKQATTVMQLAYAGQMITGLLVGTVLTRFLTSRRTG
ncbi:hypothetical protein DEJ50_25760 [Streptomyces venezuelae]|uniref:Uncharacterized protein n=1 Tax=Streptomyces venezuelae TaxID=54571 RepID=A0A5P2DBX0_STRVZ|nr:hypothetical protein DEJ50_25760 [Streptomyces venezuelae]